MNVTPTVQIPQATLARCPLGYPNSSSCIYYKKMSAAPPVDEIQQPEPVPLLLVELPSWPRVFFGNLRDLIFPRRLPPLELQSAPGPFWPDVLVKRGLPWAPFLQSVAYHVLAFALLIAFTRFFALQAQVIARPTFDRAQVIYYTPSEYLPPIDTRDQQAAQPAKADPEFSPQPIISVPSEADNRSQTIVTPPNVKLKHDVALPNIVAWSEKLEKPQLAILPVPLTPAAEITRIAPQIENAVVKPPPDAADLAQRRNLPSTQNSVVAPPPGVSASNPAAFQAPQPALIAPPPSVENASTRPLGDLNMGPSSVIAPAPRLPVAEQSVAEQRAVAGSRLSGVGAGTSQVVAPPPSLSASGSSAGSFGAPGRIIALNLHPTVGAPPAPPAGNRRGSFAATPEGHSGASGSPGANSRNAASGAGSGSSGKESGSGPTRKGSTDLPAGLYVGNTAAKPSPVVGSKSSTDSVNPSLIASVRPPRVSSASPSRSMQPESAAKLSEPERAVFGNRKFYSVTLNMPNLNSAGGSWIIRFAELNRDSNNHDSNIHDSNNHDANSSADDLSQPAATRKVDPAYPLQLMRENVAGTVILYAIIHADGTVGNVRVLRGVDDRLDQFASQAIAQWQFHPAMKNGYPVDVEATFQIPFRPAHVGSNF
jgi:TonB family protein